MECLYIMFYVVELSASEHLFEISVIQIWYLIIIISIFSKIGLVDLSKPCTQIYLQKIANCINLQLAIRISKNQAFRTCTTPSQTFRPILRSIGLLDNELPRKDNISTDGRTDGRTDGWTDRRRARQQ